MHRAIHKAMLKLMHTKAMRVIIRNMESRGKNHNFIQTTISKYSSKQNYFPLALSNIIQ